MSTGAQHSANAVVERVTNATDKVIKLAEEVGGSVDEAANGLMNSLGRVEPVLIKPMRDAKTKIDELLGSNFPPD